ncbi:MAG: transporter substrate-binding domain-containing protein, partial [Nocardioides sp.]
MRRVLILLVLLLGAILAMPAVAPAASAADAPSRPVVRVGTEGTYPPFSYIDPKSGEVTGFDIEVARAVAAKAGWDLKIVRGTFDSLFPAMDAGRIDMIANQITINPDREAHYLFST